MIWQLRDKRFGLTVKALKLGNWGPRSWGLYDTSASNGWEKPNWDYIKGCSRRMRPNLTLQSLIEQLGKDALLQTGTNEKEKRQQAPSVDNPQRCKGSSSRRLWVCRMRVLRTKRELRCPKSKRASSPSLPPRPHSQGINGDGNGFGRIMWEEPRLARQGSRRLKKCFKKHYCKKQVTSQKMWARAENRQASPTVPIPSFHLCAGHFPKMGHVCCLPSLWNTSPNGTHWEKYLRDPLSNGYVTIFQGWGSRVVLIMSTYVWGWTLSYIL